MKKTLFGLPLGKGGLRGLPRSSDEVSSSTSAIKTSPSPKGDTSPKGRGRRGFTLVELVVALVMIVLFTGVSIGVVTVNNNTNFETVDMIEATNIAENAVECFRFAVRNGGEEATFEECLNKTLNLENGATAFDSSTDAVDGVYHYTITQGRVVVNLVVDFTAKTITITAENGGVNDFLIEEVTYTVR